MIKVVNTEKEPDVIELKKVNEELLRDHYILVKNSATTKFIITRLDRTGYSVRGLYDLVSRNSFSFIHSFVSLMDFLKSVEGSIYLTKSSNEALDWICSTND